MVAIAKRNNDLFELALKVIEPTNNESTAHVAMKTLTIQMWHDRLGHPNVTYVRNVLRKNNTQFIDEEFDMINIIG